MNSFYSEQELKEIGFLNLGDNVLISRKCSIYSPGKISVGSNVRIDDFCILSGNIHIGNYVHIASYVALYGGNEGIEIEDFVGVSARSIVYSVTDDYSGNYLTNPTIPMEFKSIQDEKVVLKKHSLIGAGSIVLPGVIVEEGCSFGAMSLINKSTEPWGIYVGAPSKRLKDRSKNLLELEKKLYSE
jgi:galactoside O-acetyltransferase